MDLFGVYRGLSGIYSDGSSGGLGFRRGLRRDLNGLLTRDLYGLLRRDLYG